MSPSPFHAAYIVPTLIPVIFATVFCSCSYACCSRHGTWVSPPEPPLAPEDESKCIPLWAENLYINMISFRVKSFFSHPTFFCSSKFCFFVFLTAIALPKKLPKGENTSHFLSGAPSAWKDISLTMSWLCFIQKQRTSPTTWLSLHEKYRKM